MKISFLILIVVALLISCSEKNVNVIPGDYIYKHSTGQVEVISLSIDCTFCQNIYASEFDYEHNKRPLHDCFGNWSFDGERQELKFDPWLDYCDRSDPNIIYPKPGKVLLLNVGWMPPSNGTGGALMIYDESGYIFRAKNK